MSETNWPKRVNLRDTKLHDDLGGAGQRIFTTAGQGYEKRVYVRADVACEMEEKAVMHFAALLRSEWKSHGMERMNAFLSEVAEGGDVTLKETK